MEVIRRQLSFGAHRLEAASPEAVAAPYIIAGPRLYAIGYASGVISPIGAEHLVGEMGGIWAHPLKVADGMTLALHDTSGAPIPGADGVFSESPTEVSWRWRCDDLALTRRDRVLPGPGPAYGALITLINQGSTSAAGSLEVTAHLKILGCWFGGMATSGGAVRAVDAVLLGQDELQPGWGFALGASALPVEQRIEPRERGALATLRYDFTLEPGATRAWLLLLTVGQRGGATEAEALWHGLIETASSHFNDDGDLLAGLPRLACEDTDLARDVALAQANLRLLDADYPDTGRYFLAGLPEYPQLFGCDTTYTVPGAAAAGFAITCRSALDRLAEYAARACGRVPHEITTNGRVFNPGNIQETPQLVIALWDYIRWTGDLAFAERLFPICREGILDYLPSNGGPDPRYPIGDGMVERMGMGSRKLDSACYHIAGLRALADLAAALGRSDAPDYAARADALNRDFERDWWLEDESLYADSMHSDGRLQLDGHWTAVLPVQLGLAAPERAARVLARIEAEFVNQWGLVHTRGREELVWTLPTGLLALAAFRLGRAERGLELARNIALTAQHGTLGTFKELIPEGLCFVQLWSAGLYLQTILEGLLGLAPDAPRHHLTVAPAMPESHPPVAVRGLMVGQHRLSLTIGPRSLRIEHTEGPGPLEVAYAGTRLAVAPGTTLDRTA